MGNYIFLLTNTEPIFTLLTAKIAGLFPREEEKEGFIEYLTIC